jgi:hypothetical protein
MTCKTNERFALNTRKTKEYFKENKIVALKAMRDKNSEVDPFLAEIGNTGLGIPYYAVFVPGAAEPTQFDGIFLQSDTVLNKIKPAVASRPGEPPATTPVAVK